MKALIKYILLVLSIFLVLFFVDRIFGKLLDKLYGYQTDKVTYAIKNAHEDIVILGSSRAVAHYDSKIIENETGLSCFNYGVGGQNIYYHYAILNTLIRTHKPKIVVYELFDIDITKTASSHDKDLLNALYPAYNLNDTIHRIVNLQGTKTRNKLAISSIYKHNSNLTNYFYNILLKPAWYYSAGYIAIESGKWNKEIELLNEKYEFDNQKIEYIRRFMELCKLENIQLIFAVSPKFCIYEKNVNPVFDTIRKMALNNGIEFWYYEQDKKFLDHSDYFKDPLHLNREGATEYTKIISGKIKKIIRK